MMSRTLISLAAAAAMALVSQIGGITDGKLSPNFQSSGPVSPYAVDYQDDQPDDGRIVSPYATTPPTNEVDLLAEEVQTPVPDQLPNAMAYPDMPSESTADELRELSKQLADDAKSFRDEAAKMRSLAEDLGGNAEAMKATFGDPPTCTCTCECDCPTIDEYREVLRAELATALKEQMVAAKSAPSSGSTGGSLNASPPASSNGSTGGTIGFTSSGSTGGSLGYTSPPPFSVPGTGLPFTRDSPQRVKVTIHKFASGRRCPPCERWLRDVAPVLQSRGVIVTEISDVKSGTAPLIDVCVGDTCQQFVGYTDADTLMSSLE